MLPEKREHQIAMETEAGREGLAVWRRVVSSMSGPQKVAKAFELTEMTRQIMRQGIRGNIRGQRIRDSGNVCRSFVAVPRHFACRGSAEAARTSDREIAKWTTRVARLLLFP